MGRAWLVPTSPPLTVRELATRFTSSTGRRGPVTRCPTRYVGGGLFSPTVKELRTTRDPSSPKAVRAQRQHDLTEKMLGLQPIAMDEALRDAAARLRA